MIAPHGWTPAIGVETRWHPYASLDDIGLPHCPEDWGDEDSEMAIRIWAALYDERSAAFDAWYAREARLAAAALADVRDLIVGRAPQIAFAARGSAHVALFGWDGRGHTIERLVGEVGLSGRHGHDLSGATVSVCVGETFGGGERWFGPPGHRTYWYDFPVEGRSPWDRPPADEGLKSVIVRREERNMARQLRRAGAVARVKEVVEQLYDAAAWEPRARRRSERIAARLWAQVNALDLRLPERPRGPADVEPIDVWPCRSRRPVRRLPVLDRIERGWYAASVGLRAGGS